MQPCLENSIFSSQQLAIRTLEKKSRDNLQLVLANLPSGVLGDRDDTERTRVLVDIKNDSLQRFLFEFLNDCEFDDFPKFKWRTRRNGVKIYSKNCGNDWRIHKFNCETLWKREFFAYICWSPQGNRGHYWHFFPFIRLVVFISNDCMKLAFFLGAMTYHFIGSDTSSKVDCDFFDVIANSWHWPIQNFTSSGLTKKIWKNIQQTIFYCRYSSHSPYLRCILIGNASSRCCFHPATDKFFFTNVEIDPNKDEISKLRYRSKIGTYTLFKKKSSKNTSIDIQSHLNWAYFSRAWRCCFSSCAWRRRWLFLCWWVRVCAFSFSLEDAGAHFEPQRLLFAWRYWCFGCPQNFQCLECVCVEAGCLHQESALCLVPHFFSVGIQSLHPWFSR